MRLIFLKNVWRKNTHAIYKFRIQDNTTRKPLDIPGMFDGMEKISVCRVFGTPFTFPCSFIFTVNKKIFIFFH